MRTNLLPTLNSMGYMFNDITEYGKVFIEIAGKVEHPVLDIACAYGNITIEALKNGADVIANDLDERHLKYLEKKIPQSLKSNLRILPGRFPSEINLNECSLGSVLASNIFHFLTGEEILEGIRKIHHWLVPGGQFILVTGTPYTRMWEEFIPLFLKHKESGEAWPGFFPDISQCTSFRKTQLPDFIHFLDVDILLPILLKSGFTVVNADYISQTTWPRDMRLDGRESIGIICQKPSLQ